MAKSASRSSSIVPTTTIRPSAWMARSRASSSAGRPKTSTPKSVVTIPSPLNVGSRSPSGSNRATAKSPPVRPVATILPSGCTATPSAIEPKPKSAMAMPRAPKLVSGSPSVV